MPTKRRIEIVEVGPRDGLQNEPTTVSVAERIALIEGLAAAGLTTIEAGSFVPPRWVPQMAGTAEVLAGVRNLPGPTLPVLVPNLRGLQAAIAAGVECVAIFAAATEAFSRANLNASRDDAFQRFAEVARAARAAGLSVRGYVSCAVHCHYEGWVAPAEAAELAYRLMELGCFEVSLCDTTGRGDVERAIAMAEAAIAAVSASSLAAHFHDTCGFALQNSAACIDLGIARIDASVAGLGGCPYSPGAKGNLSTESLVEMLDANGFAHGVDRPALQRASARIRGVLGRAFAA